MIEFRALGSTSLQGSEGNQLHSVLSRPKIFSLLAALALGKKGDYLRRERLLGLLWADTDPERARASLRQGLYTLRQSLGSAALVSRGEDEILLNPETIWIDVWEFEEALEEGKLAKAMELFRGPLLDGFAPNQAPELERWLEVRRRDLQKKAAEAALALARASAQEENPSASGHWARKAAELGGADEVLIRGCLETLGAIGDLAGAGEVYQRLERTLREDLDVSPSPETQAVIRRLREPGAEAGPGDPQETLFRSAAPADADGAPGYAQGDPLQADSAPEGHGRGAGRQGEGSGDPDYPSESATTRKRGFWRTPALAAGAVAVIAATWLATGLLGDPNPSSPSGETPPAVTYPRSVLAVLPFKGDGLDPGTDQFAAGVHQEILSELARVSDLTVLSRRAVEPYRDTDLSIQAISSELGAGSILEGTVRWDDNRVRVSVELTDPATRAQVWAGSYDRELSGLLQAQRAVAQEVAMALEATLSSPDDLETDRFLHLDPRVVGLYLRAMGVGGEWPTEEGIFEEEQLLRVALELDPQFAAAWAALGQNFARRPSELGMSQTWTDSAMVAAHQALSLDPELPEGYLALGTAYHAKGQLDLALLNFDRAVALDPNLAEARHKRGFVLASQGKLDRALIDQEYALRRDPNNAAIRVRTGRLYALLGDMEEAERMAMEGISLERLAPSGVFLVEAEMHLWGGHADAAFRTGIQAVQAGPDDSVIRAFLADLAYQAGECETAATEARRALDQVDDPGDLAYYFHARTILGFSLRACGEDELGLQTLEDARGNLEAQIESGVTLPLRGIELAAVLDELGSREEARAWLRWAFDHGSRHLGFLRRHPMFEGLRADPEVQSIIDEMQADVDQMRTRLSSTTPSGSAP